MGGVDKFVHFFYGFFGHKDKYHGVLVTKKKGVTVCRIVLCFLIRFFFGTYLVLTTPYHHLPNWGVRWGEVSGGMVGANVGS